MHETTSKLNFFAFLAIFLSCCNLVSSNLRGKKPQLFYSFPKNFVIAKSLTNGWSRATVLKAIDHNKNGTIVILKGSYFTYEIDNEENALELLATANSTFFEKIFDRFILNNEHYLVKEFIDGIHFDVFDLNSAHQTQILKLLFELIEMIETLNKFRVCHNEYLLFLNFKFAWPKYYGDTRL